MSKINDDAMLERDLQISSLKNDVEKAKDDMAKYKKQYSLRLEEATGNAPSQLDGQARAASILKDIPAIHDLYENLMAKDETIDPL